MKKLIVASALTAGIVFGTATPSFAFFCTNANKQPDAGAVEFKDSTAVEHANSNSRADNSTGTGAWLDVGGGTTIFARNGLAPAAFVGSPDHGIVEAE